MGQIVQQERLTQRPLKVLSISHSAMKQSSERSRYVHLAANRDIDLTLVVPDKWKQFGYKWVADPSTSSLDMRIRPIRLGKVGKAKWYLHYYPGLADLVAKLSPDVIHLWEEPWSAVALQAARLCERQTPRPALVLETEQNILYRLPFPFEQIRRYTLSRADALVVRQAEALEVCRACGYQGAGVIVEYWADTTKFYPDDRHGARNEFGLCSFTIGYVGRIVEDKGLFTILEALRLCKQDVNFLLLGDGPDRERLIQHAQHLGLGGRVRFLPPVRPDGVRRFMNALDALTLMSITTPTWKEQFGRVIMEAQACSVPTIGSSSGAIPSVVGKAGWIVQESDARQLSHLLDRLAASPDEVAAKAEEGLQQVHGRFSPKTISTALHNAFIEGVRRRNSRTVSGALRGPCPGESL
jgi:glycosyltransferase involved in cell wall biosynthesis